MEKWDLVAFSGHELLDSRQHPDPVSLVIVTRVTNTTPSFSKS